METFTNYGHIGRKIARIRELKSIKQDTLAFDLGVSQQTVSRMEASEKIEDELLEKVAKVLGVSADGIKNFSEEAVLNIINNTYNNHDNSSTIQGHVINYNPTFNPLDKWMEVIEENKKLYERLLQSEKEKVELLRTSRK